MNTMINLWDNSDTFCNCDHQKNFNKVDNRIAIHLQ